MAVYNLKIITTILLAIKEVVIGSTYFHKTEKVKTNNK